MSEITASNCGCEMKNDCGCSRSIIWIIILLAIFNNDSCDCGCGFFNMFGRSGDNGCGCEIIIILILLSICGCGNIF